MSRYFLQEEAMSSLQVDTVPRTIVVPVSTRAVGFMTQFLFCEFVNQFKLPVGASVYQLYRVTLLQFEIKLMEALHKQCYLNNGGEMYRSLNITIDQTQIVSALGGQFVPLANLINSVGVVRIFKSDFLPRIAVLNDARTVLPDPTVVTFSNLRTTVTALAHRSTPLIYRQWFYNNNPLPGARWEKTSQSGTSKRRGPDDPDEPELDPILLNPDDYMPDGYSDSDLHADVSSVRYLLKVVERKYVDINRIDYKAEGNRSILVSNDPSNIRCSDLRWIGDRVDYKSQRPIEGGLTDFWSPRFLPGPEFYMGINHLVGELPHPELRTEAYAIRSSMSAEQKTKMNYITLLNILFRQSLQHIPN